MLTAEFPPSSGDATIAGFSVSHQPEAIRRRVGYCPQFDAHFENLTGREHVELYASIKGVPNNMIKAAAAAKLAAVGLSAADADRLSAQYSGGMKRRLSLACALIGQPQIVFLDEATTGVDPVARREIWKVISDHVTGDKHLPESEKPSIVLTTHSMEECGMSIISFLCGTVALQPRTNAHLFSIAQRLFAQDLESWRTEDYAAWDRRST